MEPKLVPIPIPLHSFFYTRSSTLIPLLLLLLHSFLFFFFFFFYTHSSTLIPLHSFLYTHSSTLISLHSFLYTHSSSSSSSSSSLTLTLFLSFSSSSSPSSSSSSYVGASAVIRGIQRGRTGSRRTPRALRCLTIRQVAHGKVGTPTSEPRSNSSQILTQSQSNTYTVYSQISRLIFPVKYPTYFSQILYHPTQISYGKVYLWSLDQQRWSATFPGIFRKK